MLSQVTQIHSSLKIRRNRTLPVPGMVFVRTGQKVASSEVLAESQIPTRHITIDVSQALGLKDLENFEKVINRKVGEQLDKHDVVAETGGAFSRLIRTPIAGKIVSIKNGLVVLEVESQSAALQSGYNGTVVEVIKDFGAVVETNGVLIQGVWGNGKSGSGPFVLEPGTIDQELISSALNITARGTIMAAAFCEKEESLINAENLPLAGLILGSMDPRLIPLAQKQNFPIILLEGFGKAGINEVARNLLLENTQHEMSINATKWDHFNGARPEISIAKPEDGDLEKALVQCTEGQMIRVHSAEYAGQVGVITAINSGKTTLPNGLRTVTASVLINNKNVVVPLANFDIINSEKSTLG